MEAYFLCSSVDKLNIIIEIIIEIFHDNNFFIAFFRLNWFWVILYRRIGLILRPLASEKSACVRACVLRARGA